MHLIGAQADAIEKAEDREKFKKEMDKVGIDTAKGGFVNNYEDAKNLLDTINFPIIIRPSLLWVAPEDQSPIIKKNIRS